MIYHYLDLINAFQEDLRGSESHLPTNLEILAKYYINRAKDKVEIDLQAQFESTSYLMYTVSGQDYYTLPVNAAYGGLNRIRVETGVGTDTYTEYTLQSDKDFDAQLYSFAYKIDSKGLGFTLFPEPTTDGVGIEIDYNIDSPDLITGTAVSATDTTIEFAEGAIPQDDIYNTVYVAIVSGTGAGQCKPITDYDGATLTATVDWDVTPDTTSVYATVPSMPERARMAIIPMAIALYRQKQKAYTDMANSLEVYKSDLNRAKKINVRGRKQPRYGNFKLRPIYNEDNLNT